MAPKVNCPTLTDWLDENNCMENFAGLGVDVYVFIKSDLQAPLSIVEGSENEYSTPTFKPGKRLYKLQCKEESVQHKDSSLGKRAGYKQEFSFALASDNAETAKINRALNNNEVGFIFRDNNDSYVVYDPVYGGKFDSDGISGDTGAAATDDRQTTYTYTLQPTLYGKYLITEPKEGWDSLLAEAVGE